MRSKAVGRLLPVLALLSPRTGSFNSCCRGREPASIPRSRSSTSTTAPTPPRRSSSTTSSSSRSTAFAGTTPNATTPPICWRSASRASGLRKACCPAIPRSPFPITSPSSPASIPSTTASSPTTSSTPRASARYSIVRSQGRHRRHLVQRHAPCGVSPRARECAPRASSGPDLKPRSPASGPPGTRSSTTRPRPRQPSSRRASTMRSPCSVCPPADRPHFITIYYSEPDHEGHEFGPDAPETRAAVLKMDELIGKLKAALDATRLPIDLVVVSDHGMVKSKAAGSRSINSPTSPASTPSALCSTARPKRIARASTTSSRKRRRSLSSIVSRMFPRISTSTRIRAKAIRLSSPPAPMPFAPTRPPAGQARPAAHRRHARLRSAQSAGDEGQLLRRRPRYSAGKDGCAV